MGGFISKVVQNPAVQETHDPDCAPFAPLALDFLEPRLFRPLFSLTEKNRGREAGTVDLAPGAEPALKQEREYKLRTIVCWMGTIYR